MILTARSLAGLGLTLAALAALGPAPAERLRQLVREVGKLPEVCPGMGSERRRRASLDEHGEKVRERIREKEAILDSLTAGRVSLFEAAASFRAVNRRLPTGHAFGQGLVRCRSDAERYCRQVLGCLRVRGGPCGRETSTAWPTAWRRTWRTTCAVTATSGFPRPSECRPVARNVPRPCARTGHGPRKPPGCRLPRWKS